MADVAESIDIEEFEPTLEELELQAAKQLLLELKMIKKRIYDSGTVMNSMLVVQIKQLLRGLMSKYQGFDLFKGENITLKLKGHGKFASFDFVYTDRLNQLFAQVVTELPPPGPIVEEVQPKVKDEESESA
jgi:hypothetical protein